MAEAEAEAQAPAHEEGDDDEDTPGYKAPAKVDLTTIQQMDADDESLVKYKQALLGNTGDPPKGELRNFLLGPFYSRDPK
jgi:Rho GDP-dissociation inhibitor